MVEKGHQLCSYSAIRGNLLQFRAISTSLAGSAYSMQEYSVVEDVDSESFVHRGLVPRLRLGDLAVSRTFPIASANLLFTRFIAWVTRSGDCLATNSCSARL